MPSVLLAFEVFDDVAFFYLALSVLAIAVLPWTLTKIGVEVYERFIRPPQTIPLTRIQKLKLAQQKAGVGATGATTDAAASTPASASLSAATGATTASLRPPRKLLSPGNIILAILWLIFIYMLLQIPNMSEQNLASFKPYDILEIDSKATDAEIKVAYRKQSLKYHPDRNSSPEAPKLFMLVAKAYETLTSETAKKNIEKYGNPDGYQGVSVTIGLPSILTKKENEMRILVVYFLLFIMLPPILVGLWWRRAKDYVDGGLLKKTLQLWYQLMLPASGSKFLIEFLSIASEYEVLLTPKFPTDINAFKKLALEVKPSMVKQRFQDATKFGTYFQYSHKACVLLYAYLLRLEIPVSMKPDLDYILKESHRLLGTLIELALSRGYIRTVFGLFDLMQLITQGCFPHDSPLMQLPHISQDDSRKLNKKNIKTIHSLLKSLGVDNKQERLEKILPDMTTQQWQDIKLTGELIPDVKLSYSYSVEDEEGLYEGDLVTLKVKLERQSFDPDAAEHESSYRQSNWDGDENDVSASSSSSSSSTTVAAPKDAPKESKEDTTVAKSKSKNKRFANTAGAASSPKEGEAAGVESKEGEDATAADGEEGEEDSDEESRPMTDDEILDSMPVPKPTNKIADIRASGPSVHSLKFPYPKHEKWWILLVQKSSKKLDVIVGVHKVDSFFDEASAELKFYAPRAKSAKEDGYLPGDSSAGVYDYEIHAICDSYIGVDQISEFHMKVSKPKSSGDDIIAKAASKVEEEYAELREAEEAEAAAEEEYGPWYYLYFPTFWELALNVIVLGLLCVFIFNFLHSRGYWQRYVQPFTSFLARFTQPVIDLIYPYLAPVLEPIGSVWDKVYTFTSDMLHRDPFPKNPEDIVVDETTIPGMGQDE